MSQEPVKIVCVVEGGVLQGVLSCGVPVEVVVIDYDVQGCDEDDLVQVPQLGEDRTEPAAVGTFMADADEPAWALKLFNLADGRPPF